MGFFTLRFVDDAEFEQKHKRDHGGKFAKTPSKAIQKEKQDFTKAIRKRPLSLYLEELSTKEPVKVVEDFAKTELQHSYVRCNVLGVGPMDVSFSSTFIGEISSKLRKQNPENHKRFARQMLVALDRIDDVLKNGAKSEWEQTTDENKHADDMFSRCFKRLRDPATGREFLAVAVLKRHMKQKPTSYLVTVKGTKGFRTMLGRQRLHKTTDGVSYEVSVEYVYIKK